MAVQGREILHFSAQLGAEGVAQASVCCLGGPAEACSLESWWFSCFDLALSVVAGDLPGADIESFQSVPLPAAFPAAEPLSLTWLREATAAEGQNKGSEQSNGIEAKAPLIRHPKPNLPRTHDLKFS